MDPMVLSLKLFKMCLPLANEKLFPERFWRADTPSSIIRSMASLATYSELCKCSRCACRKVWDHMCFYCLDSSVLTNLNHTIATKVTSSFVVSKLAVKTRIHSERSGSVYDILNMMFSLPSASSVGGAGNSCCRSTGREEIFNCHSYRQNTTQTCKSRVDERSMLPQATGAACTGQPFSNSVLCTARRPLLVRRETSVFEATSDW